MTTTKPTATELKLLRNRVRWLESELVDPITIRLGAAHVEIIRECLVDARAKLDARLLVASKKVRQAASQVPSAKAMVAIGAEMVAQRAAALDGHKEENFSAALREQAADIAGRNESKCPEIMRAEVSAYLASEAYYESRKWD